MAAADVKRRNVVFVVLDTVRKDHLTPYGYDRETTPELDAVADEFAVFENAVANAPWTLPSHASMFTGRYPSEHQATQEDPYLEGTATLAESLSAAGYATGCYSSNAWITPYTGLTAGFEDRDNFFEVMPGEFLSGPLARVWRAMNDNDRLRAVADRLVQLGNWVHEQIETSGRSASKTPAAIDRITGFIEGAGSRPYFVFTNLMDAHLPYAPPPEHRDRFAPGVDPEAVCRNSKDYNIGAYDIDEDEWADLVGLYDGEIHHIDAELGRLFGWLKANGEWEDTVVVLCADHGELHGEHGLLGHEFNLYDPVVNVPLMVKAPGLDPGRYERTVELVDLYHTVLDAAGADALSEGQPFDDRRSLLRDDHRGFEGGEDAFIEYHRPVVELNQLETKARQAGITLDEDSRFYSRMRGVRRPAGKYIENERLPDEFYRLDEDPGETENRHGEDDPMEAELVEALDAFVDRVGDWGEAGSAEGALDEMSESAQDRLRDLGYIE